MIKIIGQFNHFVSICMRDFPRINKYNKKIGKYPAMDRLSIVRRFARSIAKRIMKASYSVEGLNNLPTGQVLFVPNHVSFCDPVVLLDLLERPIAFFSKKENKKVPVVGKAMQILGSVYLDRNDLRAEVRAIKNAEKEMENNPSLSFVIYPEGTRSHANDYPLGTFHPGSFKIATDRQVPIVPVCVYGTQKVLHPKYHYRRYPIQVAFLDPILPSDYEALTTKEIADLVKERIAKKEEEFKKKEPSLIQAANGYSEKKTAKVLYKPVKEGKKS